MSTLGALLDGFATALTLANLGWAFLGVTLGTAIGILPGIGPALTIALLLPVTRMLDPTGAFIMFAGIYYGAMYGSSTTSILLNTPGESGSIVTALEGNLMARQGRGAAALATAAIGSFVAGHDRHAAADLPRAGRRQARHPLRSGRVLRADGAGLHHRLGACSARRCCAGLISSVVGIGLGLVGIDKLTGQARFTFGIPELLRRHRHRGRRGRPVRGGRGALRGLAAATCAMPRSYRSRARC